MAALLDVDDGNVGGQREAPAVRGAGPAGEDDAVVRAQVDDQLVAGAAGGAPLGGWDRVPVDRVRFGLPAEIGRFLRGELVGGPVGVERAVALAPLAVAVHEDDLLGYDAE